MKKKRFKCFLYALLFISWGNAYGDVEIKSVKDNKTAQKFAQSINSLTQQYPNVSGRILVGKKNILEFGATDKAIGVFITQEEFSKLPKQVRKNVSPVFSEPDIEAQLLLIKYLWGKRTKTLNVAAIIHPENHRYRKRLVELENKHGINIEIIYADSSPAKALNKRGNVDFVLALPDRRLFSSKTLKAFINTAHRKDLPIVGFYTGMVKAGAIATTYKDVADLVNATLNLITENKTCSNFKIDFNKDVIRSYGFKFNEIEAKEYIVKSLQGGGNG